MGTGPAYVWLTVLVPIAVLLATIALQRVEDAVCPDPPPDQPEQPVLGTMAATSDVPS